MVNDHEIPINTENNLCDMVEERTAGTATLIVTVVTCDDQLLLFLNLHLLLLAGAPWLGVQLVLKAQYQTFIITLQLV